jgi:hypothetical protein
MVKRGNNLGNNQAEGNTGVASLPGREATALRAHRDLLFDWGAAPTSVPDV